MQGLTRSITIYKAAVYALLFTYFGFMAIPQWFRPLSPQFLVWLAALPVVVLVLIAIGIAGISGARQNRARNISPNTKFILFTQISSIGLVWFVISAGLSCGTHYLYNHQSFNSELWKDPISAQYVSYDLTLRQRMVSDVAQNVLPGRTRPEIEALLGESTAIGYFSQSQQDVIYLLGAERGLGVDSEWLLIWFDNSGKFERYEIITD